MLNPKPGQIYPRLFWPLLALSLLSGLAGQLILALRPQAFTLHYLRNPTVLVAVHLTTLGFLATLFLAITVQALSVLFHRPHAWPALSAWGEGLFLGGAWSLAAFLGGWGGWWTMGAGVAGMSLGLWLLGKQAFTLARVSDTGTVAWTGLKWAYIYLGCMLLLGMLMAHGLLLPLPLLPQDPMDSIRFHAHLGLWGFAGLAIFGMMPKLLRLFQGSTGYEGWPLGLAFTAVHAGIALSLMDWLGGGEAVRKAAAMAFSLGALGFAGQILLLTQAARKLKFDSSFSTQLLAVLCMLLAAGLDLWITFQGGDWRQGAAALYLALVGCVGGAIMGTLQRVVGVLSWYGRFWEASMRVSVPTAWDLVDPRLAWSVPVLHAAGTVCGFFGIWMGEAGLIRWGGWLGSGALAATLALAGLSRCRGQAGDALN